MASTRNFNGIEHAALRRHVDPTINQLHDELEVAYYQHWRQGKKHNWYGFNAEKTPEESKLLFDTLHSLLFDLQLIAIHDANIKDSDGGYPESDFRVDSVVVGKDGESGGKDKLVAAKARVDEREQGAVGTNGMRALKRAIVRDIAQKRGYDLDLDNI